MFFFLPQSSGEMAQSPQCGPAAAAAAAADWSTYQQPSDPPQRPKGAVPSRDGRPASYDTHPVAPVSGRAGVLVPQSVRSAPTAPGGPMWGGGRRQRKKKKKETFAGLRVLTGSQWAGPWVKGQSGQSCIGSTSCRSSPASCPRWGRSAGRCSGRTTPSDLPPRRGSCPRWLRPRLRHTGTVRTTFLHYWGCLCSS